jgi:hypothetical protein
MNTVLKLHSMMPYGRIRIMKNVLLCMIFLLGCSLTQGDAPSATLPPGLTTTPSPAIADAGWLLQDVCFEALVQFSGQTQIIGDMGALEAFYQASDAICQQTRPRQSVDFSQQTVVVAIRAAQGCDASLTRQTFANGSLVLQFSRSGDCPYDVIATYAAVLTQPINEVTIVDS